MERLLFFSCNRNVHVTLKMQIKPKTERQAQKLQADFKPEERKIPGLNAWFMGVNSGLDRQEGNGFCSERERERGEMKGAFALAPFSPLSYELRREKEKIQKHLCTSHKNHSEAKHHFFPSAEGIILLSGENQKELPMTSKRYVVFTYLFLREKQCKHFYEHLLSFFPSLL